MPISAVRNFYRQALLLVALVVATITSPSAAQEKPAKPFNFDFSGGNNAPPGEMEVSAKFFVQQGTNKGRLVVEATISKGWHTYSTTQPKGGSTPTTIKVKDNVDVRLAGPFVADRDPLKIPSTEFQDDKGNPLIEEEYEDRVVWTGPLELTAGVKPETLKIAVAYDGQICAPGGCIPKPFDLTAEFAGYDAPPQTPGVFKPEGSQVTLRGRVEPQTVAPGGKAKLIITAEVAPTWHVYELQNRVGASTNLPTLIVVSRKGDLTVGEPQTSAKPHAAKAGSSDLAYYEGQVEWNIELTVPASAKPGDVDVGGFIGFQTCTDNSCLPGLGAAFNVTLKIADKSATGSTPFEFSSASYDDAKKQAEIYNQVSRGGPSVAQPPLPVPLLILLSLAGGLFLNFMPCVLPVLGLKLISFAKQGGESRSRMIAINLSYTAGLMVVFMTLAVLSITIGLAWGEQMTHFWFRMGILVVTFALALSLFGVWEIPMPGIAGSEGSSKLQQQEGLGGAFFKGLFTTILGISCSGPLLGFVLGATLSLAPVYTILVFACIGLGMASPFLALPFIPGVRNLLPKPGDWMDTFKQIMGFVMMAAAVFFFSAVENDWKIAALSLLVGVALACWWIGKVPIYEPFKRQLTAWIAGIAAASVVGVMAFSWLGPPPPAAAIQWEEFSLARIAQLEQENKTVFVDFTADWCFNCKTNLRVAIEREDVKKLLEQNNVVAMKAEWIASKPDVEAELKRLNRPSIPVLAVYPAGNPNEVIVLDGLVWKFQVLNAIRQGGPSKISQDKANTPTTETAKVAGASSPAAR